MTRLFILALVFALAAESALAGCGTVGSGRVGLFNRVRARQMARTAQSACGSAQAAQACR